MAEVSNKNHVISSNIIDETYFQQYSSILNPEILLNSLQQVVFQLDTTGKCVFLNSTWYQLTAYTAESSIGTYLADYIHPKDRLKVQSQLQALFKSSSQKKFSITVRILSENDKSKWVVLYASAIQKEQNNTIDAITGTLTEVTNQKRTEELLETRFRFLNKLINSYPCMAYRCLNDANLTIEYVNEVCLEITGYTQKELLHKKSVSYLHFIHDDDRQRVLDTILFNTNENEYYEITHKIFTASNDDMCVFNKGRGNFSSSGELLSFEGILINFENQREEQKRLFRKTLYEPNSKFLTKDLFINRLDHALQKIKSKENYAFSILLLSIDQYSQLLANLGKNNVEYILSEIGYRLIESLDPSISLCKLQDNQLCILLESSQYSIKNITAILSQIQAQIQAPMPVDDNEVYITTSIGVVIGDKNYIEKEKVISDAEYAMNRAKNLGGARYELSDLVTHGRAALQTHIETELEQALKQDKFLVYWQPIINLTTANLIGLEARLVWPHPTRGLLFADQFVPSAEETQLITPLWEWMLNNVSKQFEQWKSTIRNIDNVSLSIVVTGATLLDTDSILRLRKKLISVKPNLCSLTVGVSEEVLLDASHTTEAMLKPIKGKNIQLLMDNYGSKQTSLTLLRNMPIDMLRLDSEIVKDCVQDQGTLIKAISSLAHELNISVIANNVETGNQIKTLKQSNVDYAQGPGVSSPIDENETIEKLSEIASKNNL